MSSHNETPPAEPTIIQTGFTVTMPDPAATEALRARVRQIHSLGMAVCRLAPGEKTPGYNGWTVAPKTPEDFFAGDGIGILSGPISAPPGYALAIVDLDCPTVVAWGDRFLPATAMIDGRPGKRKSHRYYLIPLKSIPPEWIADGSDAAKFANAGRGHTGARRRGYTRPAPTMPQGVEPPPPMTPDGQPSKYGEILAILGTGQHAATAGSTWTSDDGTRTELREWQNADGNPVDTPGTPAIVELGTLVAACDTLATAVGWIPRSQSTGANATTCVGDSTPTDNPRAVEIGRRRLQSTTNVAVSGQGGHDACFATVCELVHGLRLSDDTALNLLLEAYNPRCRPSWNESELRHKIQSARRTPPLPGRPYGYAVDGFTADDRTDTLHRREAEIVQRWEARRAERERTQPTSDTPVTPPPPPSSREGTPGPARGSATNGPPPHEPHARPGDNGPTPPSAGSPPPSAPPPPDSESESESGLYITAEDLLGMTFHRDWLVNDALVANEFALIAGKEKTLKTSFGLDLGISLATGKPFLGRWTVPQTRRVVYFTAEPGKKTTQESVARILRAKGLNPSQLGGRLQLRFDVPTLVDLAAPTYGGPSDLQRTLEYLAAFRADVAVFDPYMFMLPDGIDPRNMFGESRILKTLLKECRQRGITPIIAHHATSGEHGGGFKGGPLKPMELRDVAYPTLRQAARQWMLLSRAEVFNEEERGKHELWMRFGGSAGHGGLFRVGVDEGVTTVGGPGRTWRVRIEQASEAIARTKDERERKKDNEDADNDRKTDQRVYNAIRDVTATGRLATKKAIGERLRDDNNGMGNPKLKDALERLIEGGTVTLTTTAVRGAQTATYSLTTTPSPETCTEGSTDGQNEE